MTNAVLKSSVTDCPLVVLQIRVLQEILAKEICPQLAALLSFNTVTLNMDR